MSTPLSTLYRDVLENLQVYGPGGSVTADDQEVVSKAYTRTHARLKEDRLVYWAVTDEVPDAATEPIMMILSRACFKPFSPPLLDYNTIVAESIVAEKILARQMTQRYVPEVTEADYL